MEQGISATGDHYGIDDEGEFGGGLCESSFENIGDASDDLVGVEQSRFDGGDGKGLEEEANLFGDNFGSDGVALTLPGTSATTQVIAVTA